MSFGEIFSDTVNHFELVGPKAEGSLETCFIGFSKILSALGVADKAAVDSNIFQLCGADFACECAL